MMSDDNLLTVSQVAKKTGYSPGTIYNLVSQGRIPYKKLSRRALRFDPEEINKWIAEQTESFRRLEDQEAKTA